MLLWIPKVRTVLKNTEFNKLTSFTVESTIEIKQREIPSIINI